MVYYEIYNREGIWEIWKWENNGITCKCSLFKRYKRKSAAEEWAKSCWNQVIWR